MRVQEAAQHTVCVCMCVYHYKIRASKHVTVQMDRNFTNIYDLGALKCCKQFHCPFVVDETYKKPRWRSQKSLECGIIINNSTI